MSKCCLHYVYKLHCTLLLATPAVLLAMEDVKAVLIKLACRVHNMKTISALPRDKQIPFAQETLDVFSVVANRLGIWNLKAQLEDLAFSVLHPEEYEALQSQVCSAVHSCACSVNRASSIVSVVVVSAPVARSRCSVGATCHL